MDTVRFLDQYEELFDNEVIETGDATAKHFYSITMKCERCKVTKNRKAPFDKKPKRVSWECSRCGLKNLATIKYT